MHDYCGVVSVRSNMLVATDELWSVVMQESTFDLGSYVMDPAQCPRRPGSTPSSILHSSSFLSPSLVIYRTCLTQHLFSKLTTHQHVQELPTKATWLHLRKGVTVFL
jgi:hypothetical protein